MNLLQDLLEALKPSQYRKYVKGWDKKKYEDLFRKYTQDRKAYRIYIPLKGEPKYVEPDREVEAAVEAAGYEIEDYVTGIASKDDGKRKIKIGKLLKDPKLQQKFANDPKRASSKNVENFIVISRHPYDIAGMSTDRGWRSCMNLKDGINRHYVPIDIKEGTLVAYLVRADDKNINNPIARVLIKPFVNIDKEAPEDQKVALGVEDRVYGTPMNGFRETVLKWVDEVNDSKKLDGIFKFHPGLYNDGGTKSNMGVGPTGKLYDLIKADWKKIGELDNPSKSLVDYALMRSNGAAVMYLKNATQHDVETAFENAHYDRWDDYKMVKEMVDKAIKMKMLSKKSKETILKNAPALIGYLPGVTEDEIKAAIEEDVSVLEYVKEMSDDLKEFAIQTNPFSIKYIKDPSEDLVIKAIDKASDDSFGRSASDMGQIITAAHKAGAKITPKIVHHAVDINHSVLNYIDEDMIQDEHVQKAFEKDAGHFPRLKNPTDEQTLKGIKHNPNFILHVKKPTAEQMLAAVKKQGPLLQYMIDSSHWKNLEVPDEVIKAAIKQDPVSIKFVPADRQTEEIQNLFLDEKGENVDRWYKKVGHNVLKNPSEAVMRKAIGLDPDWITHLKNPPEDLVMVAVKKNPFVVSEMQNPPESAIMYAIEKTPKSDWRDLLYDLRNVTEKVAMAAVKKFGGQVVETLNNNFGHRDSDKVLTDDVVREAIKTYGKAIRYINDPTPEDFEVALKNNHDAIRHVHEKHKGFISKETMKRILKKDGDLIHYFPISATNDEDLVAIAVKNYPFVIGDTFLDEETEETKNIPEKIQLLAIKSSKVGDSTSQFDARRVVTAIGTFLAPSVAKIAVEKDHEAYSAIRNIVTKMKRKMVKSLSRKPTRMTPAPFKDKFTKEFMEELKEISKGTKASHVAKIKSRKETMKAASTIKPTKSPKKEIVDFVKDNPSNFKDTVHSYNSNAMAREFAAELIEHEVLADSAVSYVVETEDDDSVRVIVFCKDKKPVAWIRWDDHVGFIPGLKKKKVKESLHYTTFKSMLQEKKNETE